MRGESLEASAPWRANYSVPSPPIALVCAGLAQPFVDWELPTVYKFVYEFSGPRP